MDYNNMETPTIENKPKRPTFITVLCILTWIGCAFAVFGGIVGYFTTKIQCANMDTMGALYENNPLGEDLRETMDKACQNIGLSTVINVVCGLICLVGSILMWQLKKLGFYIYTAGELAPVIATAVLGAGGFLGTIGLVVGGVFALVWVILYGINLKHMH